MGDLLWQLIPIALFGAASPLPITVVVTLLMSERGVAKAIAFGGGLMGVLAIIGVFTLSRQRQQRFEQHAIGGGRHDHRRAGRAVRVDGGQTDRQRA